MSKFPPITFTPEEVAALKEFRDKVASLPLTSEQREDAYLVRWLRAREFNLDKSFEMLKKHLEWRKENNVDGILEREKIPDELNKMGPYATCGVDAEGYPILLFPYGMQDLRSMVEKFGLETMLRFNIIRCEEMMAYLKTVSEEQGRPVYQFTQICDLDGYNYRQLTSKQSREFMMKMQTVFEANYPDVMRYCLAVNTPKVFYVMYSMMKPFMPKDTLEKIQIFGYDQENWKPILAEKFPLELIPPHWGGDKKGIDEYCSNDPMWLPGPVDPNFFQGASGITDEDGLTRATVASRSKIRIEVKVTKPGSTIRWTFASEDHDIGFELKSEGNVILPMERKQAHLDLQEGSHKVEKEGTYKLVFDNTYSWATSKVVWYKVEVYGPGEEPKEEK